MRIFLDAMGGDNAPQAPVAGALEALRRFPRLEIVLAGDPAAIEPLLKDGEDVRSRLTVLDAPEVITNHESPVMGVRRKTKSATVIGMLQLRDKEVDGFVSAGSTGAVLAGGMFRLGRIPGIERPAPQRKGELSAHRLRRQRGLPGRLAQPVCRYGQRLHGERHGHCQSPGRSHQYWRRK